MFIADELFGRDVVLENEVVKLVPFGDQYKEGLAKIIYDKEISLYTGNHIESRDDLHDYISSNIKIRESKQGYPFIVIDKRDNQVAGSTRYGHIGFESGRLEIGWTWYGQAYRGTGMNQAVKYELLKFAFETMEFRRVQFSVDTRNLRSQRAVQKLGATQEGVFRCNYLDADGISRDDIYYSIIHSEWPGIRDSIFRGNE
jgi:RimJ/RimL family protein N-acetyltransferase